MQAGMDLQMIGFGLMSTYHGNNEYALLSDMRDGARILAHFIANFEETSRAGSGGNTVAGQVQ
jgi:acetylornithine deacetylase/succinyl-diaminopimelate desuccinylase-like protein